jgi:hypothetical protein
MKSHLVLFFCFVNKPYHTYTLLCIRFLSHKSTGNHSHTFHSAPSTSTRFNENFYSHYPEQIQNVWNSHSHPFYQQRRNHPQSPCDQLRPGQSGGKALRHHFHQREIPEREIPHAELLLAIPPVPADSGSSHPFKLVPAPVRRQSLQLAWWS